MDIEVNDYSQTLDASHFKHRNAAYKSRSSLGGYNHHTKLDYSCGDPFYNIK
jgi:hypothetical protein